MSDLKYDALKGVVWSSVERFSVQGIQFILSFVIARQLSPSDYGLVAMLSIFIAIAQSFIDSGFSSALIQKQDRTNKDYSTVFYFSIVVALLFFILFYLLSPLIAKFYEQEALKDITVFIALNFIILAFSIIQRAQLTINLDFKKQAIASFISVIISGALAVYMAYNGYGVWTLVFQSIINNLINTILLWIIVKWKPQIAFSITSFKTLFGFGSKILAGGLINTIYTNLYSLIIGKVYSTTDLGFFNRASSMTQYPSMNISNILTRVTYPIECRLQYEDEELQKKFYLFINLTSFVVFPLMTGLSVLSEPLVEFILTEKWLGCVPYIQILSFAYMWDPIMRMLGDLLNAKHRSDFYLKAEVIKKTTAIVILLLTMRFGLKIMCCGLVIYSFLDILSATLYTKKILPQITFPKIIMSVFPILLQSAVMGICISICIMKIEYAWGKIIVGLGVGILSYILLSLVMNKKIIMYIISLLYRNN